MTQNFSESEDEYENDSNEDFDIGCLNQLKRENSSDEDEKLGYPPNKDKTRNVVKEKKSATHVPALNVRQDEINHELSYENSRQRCKI